MSKKKNNTHDNTIDVPDNMLTSKEEVIKRRQEEKNLFEEMKELIQKSDPGAAS